VQRNRCRGTLRIKYKERNLLPNQLIAPNGKLATLPVKSKADIYAAVGLGRLKAEDIGFEYVDQIQIETIIVALANNVLQQGGGTLTLQCVERHDLPDGNGQLGLEVCVRSDENDSDSVDLAQALAGKCGNSIGIDKNVLHVRHLADEFSIDCVLWQGTRVSARKWGRVVSRQLG
jgi:hypothetical protein